MGRMRVLGAAAAVLLATSGCAWVGRVGVSNSGAQPTGSTALIVGNDISVDGRFIVFTSAAGNLVPNDTNDTFDVFLRDNQAKTTERVSIADDEAQTPQGGFGGKVSADGRYVAFSSGSANLVAGDTNMSLDVFLRDRQAGTTVRVSVKGANTQVSGSSLLDDMTPDARFVTFTSDADDVVVLDENSSTDVFLRDRTTAVTRRLSMATDGTEGDTDSFGSSMSNDGLYVVFVSASATLDPDNACGCTDVFLRDRNTGATTRVTVSQGGTLVDGNSVNPIISGDGKVIVFDSDALSLIDPADGNGLTDVYATARASGVFQRVSDSLDPSDPEDPLSARDANGDSTMSGVSYDGRFVSFTSGAKNLLSQPLAATQNSFIRDRTTGVTHLAGTTTAMGEPSSVDPSLAGSMSAGMSDDGRYLLFASNASDVVSPDSNSTGPDLYQASNPVPLILAASPTTVARGTTSTMSLLGLNLRAQGALVLMGDGITVNNVTQVNETRIDVSITVAANAPPGFRMPFLVQAGTGAGGFTGGVVFLPNAFSVV